MWWRELGEVENECILHNFSVFTIFLPQVIKIGGNLTKLWQKQFCTVFLRHGVLWLWLVQQQCFVVLVINEVRKSAHQILYRNSLQSCTFHCHELWVVWPVLLNSTSICCSGSRVCFIYLLSVVSLTGKISRQSFRYWWSRIFGPLLTTCGTTWPTSFLLLFMIRISSSLYHHPALLYEHALILSWTDILIIFMPFSFRLTPLKPNSSNYYAVLISDIRALWRSALSAWAP